MPRSWRRTWTVGSGWSPASWRPTWTQRAWTTTATLWRWSRPSSSSSVNWRTRSSWARSSWSVWWTVCRWTRGRCSDDRRRISTPEAATCGIIIFMYCYIVFIKVKYWGTEMGRIFFWRFICSLRWVDQTDPWVKTTASLRPKLSNQQLPPFIFHFLPSSAFRASRYFWFKTQHVNSPGLKLWS